jgi:hypothetical protein
MGRGAVGALQVQMDIDIVALGENVGRLDLAARRPGAGRLEHRGNLFAGIQPRLIDRQQSVADRTVRMGRLDVDLYRDRLPADNGGEVLAGVNIALAEDMAEGDFTRLLRVARVVLKLHGGDLSPGLEADGRSGALSAPLGAATFTIAGAAAVLDRRVVDMVLNTRVQRD